MNRKFAGLFFSTLLSLSSGFAAQCDSACLYDCHRLYVGVEGGWVTGLGGITDIQLDTNETMNGVSTGGIGRSGYFVGANLDYRCFTPLRLGVSYTFCDLDYFWLTGVQTTVTDVFHMIYQANLQSHIVLLNGYLHLKDLLPKKCPIPSLDPYIVGGLGAAWNYLHDIDEYVAGGLGVPAFHSATITSKMKTSFSARFGFGILTDLSRCFAIDVGGYIYFLGQAKSGDMRRELTTPFAEEPIYNFEFNENWIGAFYVGLKYKF